METRHLLPAEAYWSDEWFDREQDAALQPHLAPGRPRATSWPSRVDFVTYTAGHDPLVVVRDLDGELRAFHNLCRHRGMPLLEGCGSTRGPGSCARTTSGTSGSTARCASCPSPTSSRISTWRAGACCPASVGTWGGLRVRAPRPRRRVGRRVAGRAAGQHRPLPARAARGGRPPRVRRPLQLEALRREPRRRVPPLVPARPHARRLRPRPVRVAAARPELGELRAGARGRRPAAGPTPCAGRSSTSTSATASASGPTPLFPNVLMASEAGYFITYAARPTGPDRCVVDLRIRAEPGADAEGLLAGAKAFIVEDIAACEGLQATVRSNRFAGRSDGRRPRAADHLLPRAPARGAGA